MCLGAIKPKNLNIREYQRAILNGQSRDTDNIGHTRRRQAKQKNTTQKTKKMSNTDPTKT